MRSCTWLTGCAIPKPVANDRLGWLPEAAGKERIAMRGTLKIARSEFADRDDQAAMSAALERLYGAAVHSVTGIVENLSASERAKLAVFCYGRAHLNTIGLTIAATCDLDQLIAASSSAAAGHVLYTQSREITPEKRAISRRPTVTLAAGVGRQFASLGDVTLGDAAELTA